jgi:hypothetical protein
MPLTKNVPTQNVRQVEGDDSFIAMIMADDRSVLPPGYYPMAINKRIEAGRACTRKGTFPPLFANAVPYDAICGDGVYRNPNGSAVMLVATPTEVKIIRDGTAPGTVTIPAGVTLAAPCEFVQAFDKVVLFRGPDAAPLVWTGSPETGFAAITQDGDDPDFLDPIPNADTAENYKDRLVVPFDHDSIAVSDVENYTVYDRDLANFRINNGSSDALVRIFPFGDTLIMFKEQSKLVLANSTNDATSAVMSPLSNTRGCWARRTVQELGSGAGVEGGAVLYLNNPGGVYALRHAVGSERVEDSPLPVGAREISGKMINPIAPLIRRINWPVARLTACAEAVGDDYFLAVPLDGSTYNNALLHYNGVSDGWEAYHTWAGPMQLSSLRTTLYLGALRLYALDYNAKAIYVLFEGKTDLLADGEYQIADTFETRGYAEIPETGPGQRVTRKAQLALATWAPSYSVTHLTDGVNEEVTLCNDVTKSRVKYMQFGKANFAENNENDDFATPRREDYSVSLSGEGVYLGDNGIRLEQKQEIMEPFVLRARGRWNALRIENSQGSCDIVGAAVESIPAENNFRRAA